MSRKRNEKLWQIVREYYPTMTAAEIHRRYGFDAGRVNKIAQYLGISHNAETKTRIMEEKRQSVIHMKKFWDPEKVRKKCKVIHKLEERRVLSGEPQKTKYRIRILSYKTYQAKYHLCRHYGYESDPKDLYTLYYTKDQKRSKYETDLAKRYKFQFKEKDNDHGLK